MNGIPDWLYEEEILSKESAIWFSPEGTRLLYASFNDTVVDQTVYPIYGNYEDNLNTSPEMMSVRYPKVCVKNTNSRQIHHAISFLVFRGAIGKCITKSFLYLPFKRSISRCLFAHSNCNLLILIAGKTESQGNPLCCQ